MAELRQVLLAAAKDRSTAFRLIWVGSFLEPKDGEPMGQHANSYMGVLCRRTIEVELPELRDLEEIEIMLTEQSPTWAESWTAKGINEGRKIGINEGRKVGLLEGRREGRRQGEATMLSRLLERRFGVLDETVHRRIEDADAECLLEWGDRILTAERIDDVFGD